METITMITAISQTPAGKLLASAVFKALLAKGIDWAIERIADKDDCIEVVWVAAVAELRENGQLPDFQARQLWKMTDLLGSGAFLDPDEFRHQLRTGGINEDIAESLRRLLIEAIAPIVEKHSITSPIAHSMTTVLDHKALQNQVELARRDVLAEIRAQVPQIGGVQHTDPPAHSSVATAFAKELDRARVLLIKNQYPRAKREYESLVGRVNQLPDDEETDEARFRAYSGLAIAWANLPLLPNHIERCLDYWEKALAIRPEDPDALSHAAMSDLIVGDAGSAADRARRAVDAHPRHCRARSALAQATLALENAEAALTQVYEWTAERGVPEDGLELEDATECATVALLLGENRNNREALHYAKKAYELDPESADNARVYGAIAFSVAVEERSEGPLMEVMKSADTAMLELSEKMLSEAVAQSKASGDRRSLLPALQALMQVKLLMEEWDAALTLATEALEMQPEDESALAILNIVALELGHPEILIEALSIFDNDPPPAYKLMRARALLVRGDDEDRVKAAELFRAVAEAEGVPSHLRGTAAAQWALAEASVGYEGKVAFLEQIAIELPDQVAEMQLAKGLLALAAGRGEDAEDYLSQLSGDPDRGTTAQLNRASNFIRNQGRPDAALALLDELPEEASAVAIYRSGIVELRLMALHAAARYPEYIETYEVFERDSVFSDEAGTFRRGYMDALLHCERFSEVIAEFGENPPEDTDILHGLGVACLQLGLVEQAARHLQRAAVLPYDENAPGLYVNLSAAQALRGNGPQALTAAVTARDLSDGIAAIRTEANLVQLAMRFGEGKLLAETVMSSASRDDEDAFVWAFDVRRDMPRIQEIMRAGELRALNGLRLYREGTATFYTLAIMFGCPVPELLARVRDDDRLGIEAFAANEDLRNAEMCDIGEATDIVPDYLSLLTCARLGLLGCLEACFQNLLVPRSLFDEIQTDLLRKEDPDVRKVWNFLRLSHKTRVVADDDNTTPALEERFSEFLGESTRDCVNLAATREALLLSDDARLRLLARNVGTARSSGTLSLVDYLEIRSITYDSFRPAIVCRMIHDGYFLAPLVSNDLLWAAAADGYQVGDRMETLLGVIRAPSSKPCYYVVQLVEFLRELLPDARVPPATRLQWIGHVGQVVRDIEHKVWWGVHCEGRAWRHLVWELCAVCCRIPDLPSGERLHGLDELRKALGRCFTARIVDAFGRRESARNNTV